MKNATILISLLLLLFVAWIGFSEKDRLFERKATCSSTALALFNGVWRSAPRATFTSSYDRSEDACFVLLDMDDGTIKRLVVDAFTNNSLAVFEQDRSRLGDPPDFCSVISPSGDKQICTDREEWDRLVEKHYSLRNTNPFYRK